MPRDFECTTCKLGFSVGTYHYHSFEGEFLGRDLLVCASCGLQHAVEIPRSVGLPYAHESLTQPLTDCRKLDGSCLLFPDDQWGHRTFVDDRNPESLYCHYCDQRGHITIKMELGGRCPRCSEILPRPIADWMT